MMSPVRYTRWKLRQSIHHLRHRPAALLINVRHNSEAVAVERPAQSPPEPPTIPGSFAADVFRAGPQMKLTRERADGSAHEQVFLYGRSPTTVASAKDACNLLRDVRPAACVVKTSLLQVESNLQPALAELISEPTTYCFKMPRSQAGEDEVDDTTTAMVKVNPRKRAGFLSTLWDDWLFYKVATERMGERAQRLLHLRRITRTSSRSEAAVLDEARKLHATIVLTDEASAQQSDAKAGGEDEKRTAAAMFEALRLSVRDDKALDPGHLAQMYIQLMEKQSPLFLRQAEEDERLATLLSCIETSPTVAILDLGTVVGVAHALVTQHGYTWVREWKPA